MREKNLLTVNGIIEWEVVKDGKVIKRGKQEMRSFVNNFMRYLANLFSMPTTTTAVDTITAQTSYHKIVFPYNITDKGGLIYDVAVGTALDTSSPYALSILGVNAPSGLDTYGILIGSGTTAPTPSDYKLQSQYYEGTGTGFFLHGATTIEGPTVSGNTITIKISRTFTNQAGADQVVSEVGLFARHHWRLANYNTFYISPEFHFMIARDVLASSVTVPNGATLTVRYIIQVTT